MSKRNFGGNISGKGYYIALILCAVAIGVSGYLYYRNANKNSDETPAAEVSNMQEGQDVQAAATQPGNTAADQVKEPEQDTAVQPQKTNRVVSPVSGTEVAPYAVDALAYNQTTRDWRTHKGVDIAAEAGTEVAAACDGTVYSVYEDETMGTTVVITHDGGYTTYYSSLAEEVAVKPGDTVSAGDIIGAVGCTALLESAIGDHLHFAVTCSGESVDPAEFLADAAA